MAEAVIGDDRRDGGEQPDGGGEQGLGNARRDDGERAILFRRNRGKGAHDAPDGAEQADEGRDRADRRQDVEPVGQPVDLRRDGAGHGGGEPVARAVAIDHLLRGRAPPFGDARRHHLGRGMLHLATGFVETVDILRLPEIRLELAAFLAGAAQADRKADDDRPGPDAGQQQAQHHPLHDDVGLKEQGQRGNGGGVGHRGDVWQVEGHGWRSSPWQRRLKISVQALGCRCGRPCGVSHATQMLASVNCSSPRMTD